MKLKRKGYASQYKFRRTITQSCKKDDIHCTNLRVKTSRWKVRAKPERLCSAEAHEGTGEGIGSTLACRKKLEEGSPIQRRRAIARGIVRSHTQPKQRRKELISEQKPPFLGLVYPSGNCFPSVKETRKTTQGDGIDRPLFMCKTCHKRRNQSTHADKERHYRQPVTTSAYRYYCGIHSQWQRNHIPQQRWLKYLEKTVSQSSVATAENGPDFATAPTSWDRTERSNDAVPICFCIDSIIFLFNF